MPRTYTKTDLVFLVSGADIVGQMEASGAPIYVETDEELTDFLIEEYENYFAMEDFPSWFDYIEARAREVFAVWKEE